MHGQQNIKIYQHVSAVTYSHLVLPDDGYRLWPEYVGVVSRICTSAINQ